jgi:hypothetical protein
VGDDVVEQGGRRRFPAVSWRVSRGAALLGTMGLLAGLAAGYAVGDNQAGSSARPLRPTASAASSSLAAPPAAPSTPAALPPVVALAQSTGACSAQVGRELQLGVQVANEGTAQVTLRQVRAVLPLGGLKPVSQQWAPCGALPATVQDPASNGLPPGASTWLTITFKVLQPCPGPLPVQFTLVYDANGQPGAIRLPGFPDLTQVSYSGCRAS